MTFPKNEADVFWENDECVFENGAKVNDEEFTDIAGVNRLRLMIESSAPVSALPP
jgi:hypothetical protein